MKRTFTILIVGIVVMTLALGVRLALRDPAARGVEAYRKGQYLHALEHFRQAAHQVDPGRIAHDQAAALYRLQRYEEAKQRYHCAEESGGNLRSARAAYDRGNCNLREACQSKGEPNADLLLQAARDYRKCLSFEKTTPGADSLFEDARHNLELTRLLLAQSPAGTNPSESALEKPGQQGSQEKSAQAPTKPGDQEQLAKAAREGRKPEEELCPE
jgi:tetratricopeptide (TPR) repeat protein